MQTQTSGGTFNNVQDKTRLLEHVPNVKRKISSAVLNGTIYTPVLMNQSETGDATSCSG